MSLMVEHARAEKARLIASVRDLSKDGIPHISDERIWQAWLDTSESVKHTPEDLKPFAPKRPDGTLLVCSSMVGAQLLIDAIEGRL